MTREIKPNPEDDFYEKSVALSLQDELARVAVAHKEVWHIKAVPPTFPKDSTVGEGMSKSPVGGELARIIGECSGAVSVCWQPRPSTQVFDSSAASDYVEAAATEALETIIRPMVGLIDAAWGIIANVPWEVQSEDWQKAAIRWRDQFHEHMRGVLPVRVDHG